MTCTCVYGWAHCCARIKPMESSRTVSDIVAFRLEIVTDYTSHPSSISVTADGSRTYSVVRLKTVLVHHPAAKGVGRLSI
jgi:hypothetical protein